MIFPRWVLHYVLLKHPISIIKDDGKWRFKCHRCNVISYTKREVRA